MIAVCGECLIDFIPKSHSRTTSTKGLKNQKTNQAPLPLYQPYIGGSPLNTATALARLTTPVAMITRLSTDPFGQALKQYFTKNRVNIENISYGDEQTTLGFVLLPTKVGAGEEYVFYHNESADRIIKPSDIKHPLSSAITHLHFSSISLQMEPCATTYETLMKREYKNCTISLDPNVRPLFIKNPADYRKRIESWFKLINVFRASDRDLSFLYNTTSLADLKKIMRKIVLQLRFPQIGILTLGSEGVILFYPNALSMSSPNVPSSSILKILTKLKSSKPTIRNSIQELTVIPPKVRGLVDTVGAGDTFTGAFLHQLYQQGYIGYFKKSAKTVVQQRLDNVWLNNALTFAVNAAAINCTREGCDPATLAEVITFMEPTKNKAKAKTPKKP